MCTWLVLTPALSPSAPVEGGKGARSCVAFRGPQPHQAGEASWPTAVTVSQAANTYSPDSRGGAGGAQTYFGMPVGGIFACCVLPGGVLAPAASSQG